MGLPGELRNRIYEYALSSEAVHFEIIDKTDIAHMHLAKYKAEWWSCIEERIDLESSLARGRPDSDSSPSSTLVTYL